LLGRLNLQRLPTLDQSQPKCLVAGVARSGSEVAAFIGTPPKQFYAQALLPGLIAHSPGARRC
jgi:hypothetical protein